MPQKKNSTNQLPAVRRRRSADSRAHLAKKLGVKIEGISIAMLWAPEGFASRIGIKEGEFDTDLTMGTYDLIIVFTGSRVLLREFFPIAVSRLEPKGKIWICWPRKSQGQKTDLTLDTIEKLAQSLDVIEVQRCQIEEIWNAMKFKKGVIVSLSSSILQSAIAPYSISVTSSIPITPDDENTGSNSRDFSL